MNLRNFFGELKRRNVYIATSSTGRDDHPAKLKQRDVYKVAIAYAVVAWLIIQAVSIACEFCPLVRLHPLLFASAT